ncbi:MAG: hypothetical protein WAV50_02500 [Minisyncoccia bacterium]
MVTRLFSTTLAILFTITIVVPPVFFSAPQRAYAVVGVPTIVVADVSVSGVVVPVKTTLMAVLEGLTQVNTFLTQVATYAQWINTFVLQPLTFILSGNLMKALTAGVVKFVIGQANGTGAPQFAVNVRRLMQTVSDSQALAYIRQINQTRSPFASSIGSALNTNYLQGSSLAGYWAANMCTLSRSSPNVNAYLAGNWSQGGVGAWFALTTQSQNNPYTLYQNSQIQMANLVTGATEARLNELNWGGGFLSWCATSDEATKAANLASTAYQTCAAGCSGSANPVGCVAQCETKTGQGGGGINPGDACTNKDGTPGTLQTPGSTIKATLDKVLGSQQDRLVQMGNIGTQINGILSAVGTIMQTVNLAQNILGGGASSGGLLNAGSASGALTTFGVPAPGTYGSASYFGSTREQIESAAAAATAAANAAANAASTGAKNAAAVESAATTIGALDMTARAGMYQTAWGTIGSKADAAESSVTSLINTCTLNAEDAKSRQTGIDPDPFLQVFIDAATQQIAAAQTALATEIVPMVTQANAVPDIAAAAIAMDALVKSELASGASSYAAHLQTLETMPPSVQETAQAQQDAQSIGTAKTNPDGSLILVPNSSANYASLVARMELISTNAAALESTICNPYSDIYTGGGGGGGA